MDITMVEMESRTLFDLCANVTETEAYRNKLYLACLMNPDVLRETFPVYWAKRTFCKEVDYVLNRLYANDPNGIWDEYDILVTPMETIEVIENWRDELSDAYQDIPGWMDKCIDYLYTIYSATKN